MSGFSATAVQVEQRWWQWVVRAAMLLASAASAVAAVACSTSMQEQLQMVGVQHMQQLLHHALDRHAELRVAARSIEWLCMVLMQLSDTAN